jgi:hypothetical protein
MRQVLSFQRLLRHSGMSSIVETNAVPRVVHMLPVEGALILNAYCNTQREIAAGDPDRNIMRIHPICHSGQKEISDGFILRTDADPVRLDEFPIEERRRFAVTVAMSLCQCPSNIPDE